MDGVPVISHIAGVPIEEAVAMAVPVLGATYVALMARLRAHRPRRRRARESAPGGGGPPA